MEEDFENDGQAEEQSVRPPNGLRGLGQKMKNKFRDFIKNGFKIGRRSLKDIFISKIFSKFVIAAIVILLLLAAFWYVIEDYPVKAAVATTDTFFQSPANVSDPEVAEYYNTTASLLLARPSDITAAANSYLKDIESKSATMYKLLSTKNEIGPRKLSEAFGSGFFGFQNIYEYILNTEKINFNRVKWTKYVRGKIPKEEDKKDVKLECDEDTGLLYPADEEIDDNKTRDDFVNMLRPYLQTWLIPLSMLSGTLTDANADYSENFVYEIIENGTHKIEVEQHTLQNIRRYKTTDHYKTTDYEITIYTKTIKENCDENGENCTEVTLYGYLISDLKEEPSESAELIEKEIEIDPEYKASDRAIGKTIEYALSKAEMFDNALQIDYDVELYDNDDVEKMINYEESKEVKAVDYTEITGLEIYEVISDASEWEPYSTVTYNVKKGTKITEEFFWKDKLKIHTYVNRAYTMADVVQYIKNKTVLDATALGYKEKVAELKATDIFSEDERKYYEGIEAQFKINRIDFLAAVNSEKEDKYKFADNGSPYISFTRKALSPAYDLLSRYLTDMIQNHSLRLNYGSSIIPDVEKMYGLSNNYYGFIWPVPYYVQQGYTISQQLSAQIDFPGKTNTYAGHTGIDIRGSLAKGKQVEIVASKAGTVVRKEDWNNSYGSHVVIQHEDGYFTCYAHMVKGSITVQTGDTVSAGQVLGIMGTTGNSTGVHLHFEIRKGESWYNSEILDPETFFNEDCSPVGTSEIVEIVKKAKELAKLKNMLYRQTGRQIYYDKDKLNSITQTDCSGFISSLYSSYMGIKIETNSETIKSQAEKGNLGGGWKAVVATYNGDTSVLQPGDVLYRKGHVGMYVGASNQIDQGGPGGTNSESNPNWKGPIEHAVSNSYTHYIRYMKAESVDSGDVTDLKNDAGLTEVLKRINATGTQKEAIEYLAPYAIAISKQYDVLPSVLIAQAGNEGGWQNIVNYKKHENGERVASLNSVFGITNSGEGTGWQDAGGDMASAVTRYATFLEENSRYAGIKTVLASGQTAEEMYKGVTNVIAQAGWCASMAGQNLTLQEVYDKYEANLNSTISYTKLYELDRYAGKAK